MRLYLIHILGLFPYFVGGIGDRTRVFYILDKHSAPEGSLSALFIEAGSLAEAGPHLFWVIQLAFLWFSLRPLIRHSGYDEVG